MDNTSGKVKGNFLKYHPDSKENWDFSSFSSNRKHPVSRDFSPAVSQQAQQPQSVTFLQWQCVT